MTLAELMAVVFIIGLLGTMAVTRYGKNLMGDVGAQGFSRKLALDCLQARRAAISTGDNHLLRFTFASGKATQYVVYRRVGAAVTQIENTRVVPTDVTVTTGGTTDMEFNFLGETLASYTITIQGPDRTKTLTVPQLTGTAFVQ